MQFVAKMPEKILICIDQARLDQYKHQIILDSNDLLTFSTSQTKKALQSVSLFQH